MPQEQQNNSLQFEIIEPYVEATGSGDTGLSSRLKLKRNFDKIKAWADALSAELATIRTLWQLDADDNLFTTHNVYSTMGIGALGRLSDTPGGGGGGGGGSAAWQDITGKPSTIAGYGITDAKIQNGVITLGGQTITPLTSSAISDMATKTWVGQQGFLTSSSISDMATKTWVGQQGFLTSSAISDMATKTWVGQQGFLTSSAISDMATKTWVGQQGFLTSSAISDMATQTWVGQQGFLTSSAITDMATQTWVNNNFYTKTEIYTLLGAITDDLSDMSGDISTLESYFTNGKANSAAQADRLAGNNTYTAWGQNYWQNGVPAGNITGNMSGVGNISMSGDIYMNNGQAIYFKENKTQPSYCNIFQFNNGNKLIFGQGAMSNGYETHVKGDTISFYVGNNTLAAKMLTDGGLQIGNGVLYWDDNKGAFYVKKADNSAAHFYATGGVGSLGVIPTGTGAGTESLYIGQLRSDLVQVGSSSKYAQFSFEDDDFCLNTVGVSSLAIGCATTIDGNLDVSGNAAVTGGLSVGGTAVIDGDWLRVNNGKIVMNVDARHLGKNDYSIELQKTIGSSTVRLVFSDGTNSVTLATLS